jgi:hypothetical protein
MFWRPVLDEVGEFDETLGAAEDYEMILRVARAFPIQVHDTVIVKYRRGSYNMSNDPALMLVNHFRVARRQRRHTSGRNDLRAASAEGLELFRESYRSQTVAQVGLALAARDWRTSLRGMATLGRCDPKSLSTLAWCLVRPHRTRT